MTDRKRMKIKMNIWESISIAGMWIFIGISALNLGSHAVTAIAFGIANTCAILLIGKQND